MRDLMPGARSPNPWGAATGRRLSLLFGVLALIIGSWVGFAPPAGADQADQARALERSRSQLQEIVGRLQTEQRALEGSEGREQSLTVALEALDRQLTEGAWRRKEMAAAHAELEAQLPLLLAEVRIQEAELARARERLGRQLRMVYELGDQGLLKVVLSQEDAAQGRRGLHYFSYLIKARNTRFRQFRSLVDRLNGSIKEHQALLARLDVLNEQLEKQRQALLTQQQQRQELLRQTRQERAQRERKVRELERSRQSLGGFVTRLEQALEASRAPRRPAPGEVAGQGPGQTPATGASGGAGEGSFGRILDRRGHLPRPVSGSGTSKPPGYFFRVDPATSVQAIFRGQVVFADWFRGYGQMIILGHGNGVYSLYGHNQRLLVTQGDWVEEGEKIAESGDTGSLEGIPGLYFEIRYRGQADNPRRWLSPG